MIRLRAATDIASGINALGRLSVEESIPLKVTTSNRSEREAGGASFAEAAARTVSRQTGQGSGLGFGRSVLCCPSAGTPGNVA
jgi:hypothetical protein